MTSHNHSHHSRAPSHAQMTQFKSGPRLTIVLSSLANEYGLAGLACQLTVAVSRTHRQLPHLYLHLPLQNAS
jgi:hypothetical protein